MKNTSDLYRLFNKITQEWEYDCVCRDCAIKIRDDIDSKFEVFYDKYATKCYTGSINENGNIDGEEEYDEGTSVELCSICGDDIPRGEDIFNFIGRIEGVDEC